MENPVFLPPSCVCVIQDDGCRIKGSEVCNMTIQTALDQFPSLRGCVCAWKEEEGEELCDSIQALATQCQLQPGAVFSVLSQISFYRWNYIFVYQRRCVVLCEQTLLCCRMRVVNIRLAVKCICWRIMFPFYPDSSSAEEERGDGLAVKHFNRTWWFFKIVHCRGFQSLSLWALR